MTRGTAVALGVVSTLLVGVGASVFVMARRDRVALIERFSADRTQQIAATAYDLWKEVLHHGSKAAEGAVPEVHIVMNSQNWMVLAIGFVVSFIVAWE